MFSIGLEFSLPKLRSMRQTVFGLGMVQVVLTIGTVLLGRPCRRSAITSASA